MSDKPLNIDVPDIAGLSGLMETVQGIMQSPHGKAIQALANSPAALAALKALPKTVSASPTPGRERQTSVLAPAPDAEDRLARKIAQELGRQNDRLKRREAARAAIDRFFANSAPPAKRRRTAPAVEALVVILDEVETRAIESRLTMDRRSIPSNYATFQDFCRRWWHTKHPKEHNPFTTTLGTFKSRCKDLCGFPNGAPTPEKKAFFRNLFPGLYQK